MRKLTLALLGASTALALCAGAGTAKALPSNVIYDALPNPPPNQGTYSHGSTSGNSGTWKDNYNISGLNFYSGNITVGWVGANVILKIQSNMPQNGVSTAIGGGLLDGFGFADIFFDLASDGMASGNNRDWDYGVDINSGIGDGGFGQVTTGDRIKDDNGGITGTGTLARLVKDPTYAYASYDNGVLRTKVCTDGFDCDNSDKGREAEVEVLDTVNTQDPTNDKIQDNVVTISKAANPLYSGAGDPDPQYVYTVVLEGVNSDRSWNEFRLFWGTGWCSNDSVEGYAKVPVPAALPIFAAAMVGFGFAGWRQRKPTA